MDSNLLLSPINTINRTHCRYDNNLSGFNNQLDTEMNIFTIAHLKVKTELRKNDIDYFIQKRRNINEHNSNSNSIKKYEDENSLSSDENQDIGEVLSIIEMISNRLNNEESDISNDHILKNLRQFFDNISFLDAEYSQIQILYEFIRFYERYSIITH